MNKKRAIVGVTFILAIVIFCVVFAMSQDEVKVADTEESKVITEEVNAEKENQKSEPEEVDAITIDSEYELVWEDNFDGDTLNLDDWNYEYHEPGWVNAEWQEYVDSEENIFLEDGCLVIQPVKMKKDGSDYYTSGRINTQNKHDFTYGRFEARCKVPNGKGFLPAFWMMPTDESFYGQWPKCGEIDIMEVLGDDVTLAHGTLHFGEPHSQRQGTYQLSEGNFSDEFHVFACEWDPGEIRFYVDNELYYSESDWFTKRKGFDEVAYPAPYDQPFYMILNVAVGGSWVGYPDASTKFEENARMVVDYVRVYQKPEYDTDVKKPEKNVTIKTADETGNLVSNSMFEENENLTDDENWKFLLFHSGVAEASISDQAIHIATSESGTEEYSVQLVQAGIPLSKGGKYKLSFDAYADKERKLVTNISAPDLNFIRYFDDQTVKLSTESQNYEFEFTMNEEDDANGRVEFNMGAMGSKETVHITNVRIEKIGQAESGGVEAYVLPDGNYIYNGNFEQGNSRLGYWEIENNCEGTDISVTNDNLTRELKVSVPDGAEKIDDVVILQSGIKVEGEKDYKLLFTARAEEDKSIGLKIAGQSFEIPLTTQPEKYYCEVHTEASLQETSLELMLGTAGTVYLDNIGMYEADKVINGNFSNEIAGYEIYVDESADATYAVDELTEGGAIGFTITQIPEEDWQICLTQKDLKLEKGKTYRIKYDAKTSLNRTIKIEVKKDNKPGEEDVTYSGEAVHGASKGYITFEHTFTMEEETDNHAVVAIYLGVIDEKTIKKPHVVYIDNIILEEVK